MKIIITMAGKGQRFRDAGYDKPKYMIEVLGKSLFEWSLLSLSEFFDSQFIFIARAEDDPSAFIDKMCHKLNISSYSVVLIQHTTDGQATSVLSAAQLINPIDEIAIYNIDTHVEEGTIKRTDLKGHGFIPGFIAEGDKWSFIQLNELGSVLNIAEKEPISNIATLGFYYFKSFELYRLYYDLAFKDSSNLVNGEKYIALIYKEMIKAGMSLFGKIYDKANVWGLGTPQDVFFFTQKYELE